MPTYYQCQRCTACCRWPGQVRLGREEVGRIATFLRLSEYEFIQRFTRLQKNRSGLALDEKLNGECVFLDGQNCRIQPVKPAQCRAFPNRWSFPGFDQQCRAIPRSVSQEEFERMCANEERSL